MEVANWLFYLPKTAMLLTISTHFTLGTIGAGPGLPNAWVDFYNK